MQITIEIPDRIVEQLGEDSKSIERRLLEVMVADTYRAGGLSTAEVGRILGFASRLETHHFLQRANVYLNYDEAELEGDMEALDRLT